MILRDLDIRFLNTSTTVCLTLDSLAQIQSQ